MIAFVLLKDEEMQDGELKSEEKDEEADIARQAEGKEDRVSRAQVRKPSSGWRFNSCPETSLSVSRREEPPCPCVCRSSHGLCLYVL